MKFLAVLVLVNIKEDKFFWNFSNLCKLVFDDMVVYIIVGGVLFDFIFYYLCVEIGLYNGFSFS